MQYVKIIRLINFSHVGGLSSALVDIAEPKRKIGVLPDKSWGVVTCEVCGETWYSLTYLTQCIACGRWACDNDNCIDHKTQLCKLCSLKRKAEAFKVTSRTHVYCPKCGAPMPPNSRFCGKCGAKLALE
jgi:ribosomal protein L40E